MVLPAIYEAEKFHRAAIVASTSLETVVCRLKRFLHTLGEAGLQDLYKEDQRPCERADVVVDSSGKSPHDLEQEYLSVV